MEKDTTDNRATVDRNHQEAPNLRFVSLSARISGCLPEEMGSIPIRTAKIKITCLKFLKVQSTFILCYGSSIGSSIRLVIERLSVQFRPVAPNF